MRKIRKFVNFDYDLRSELSAYQKAKIKKYYDEVEALTARPYYAYKPRDKRRLETAQNFAQHETHLPALKVAFIPTNGKEKPRITYNKKGEIVSRTRHVATRMINVNRWKLAENPKEYIRKLIKNDEGKAYTVLAGRYEIPQAKSKKALPDFVGKLALKYSDENKNNYVGNWLHGIASHSFSEQKDFTSYNKEKTEQKRKLQKKRRNTKERERYAKDKGR